MQVTISSDKQTAATMRTSIMQDHADAGTACPSTHTDGASTTHHTDEAPTLQDRERHDIAGQSKTRGASSPLPSAHTARAPSSDVQEEESAVVYWPGNDTSSALFPHQVETLPLPSYMLSEIFPAICSGFLGRRSGKGVPLPGPPWESQNPGGSSSRSDSPCLEEIFNSLEGMSNGLEGMNNGPAKQMPSPRHPLPFYPYRNYTPTPIHPCVPEHNPAVLGFHLLKCGHVVGVPGKDKRCGKNCMHMAMSGGEVASCFQQHVHNDNLFCAICLEIPIAVYKQRHLQESLIQAFRDVVALTTNILATRRETEDAAALQKIISPISENPDKRPYDWKREHILWCGHKVWCEPTRPCSVMCSQVGETCPVKMFPGNQTRSDAIICATCVGRVGEVFREHGSDQ